jgi:hypothetical protein
MIDDDGPKHIPPVAYRFKPGQSGNPGGRPVNSRNRLTTAFLNALARDFDRHGVGAIEAAREKDPVRYVQIVASLMPKQIEQKRPLEDLTDDELIAGIALLRARLAQSVGDGIATPPALPAIN